MATVIGEVEARGKDVARPGTTARRRLFALHSWVGFQLAIVMSVILATGTVATVSNELDWLLRAELRVTPDGERVSWQAMAEAAQAHATRDRMISLEAMQGDRFAYRARMADEHDRQYFLWVDPWTGEVTGATGVVTLQRIFRDLHRYLFMPNYIGLPLVTAFAFVLAISLYTGLKTTRKWGAAATTLRLDRGVRVATGDAHRAAGIWGTWFFVVIIATSVWYLAEFGAGVAGESFEPERPRLAPQGVTAFGDVIPARSTGEIIAAARRSFPELVPTQILYPAGASDPVTVLGTTGNIFLRERANRVFLDPASLEPLEVQRASEIGAVAWLNELADPLHFGYFGGLATKLVWFVFGLAMTGLSLTGVWLTWRRLRPGGLSRPQLATVPVLIVSLGFAIPWYQNLKGPPVPLSEAPCPLGPATDLGLELYLGLDGAGSPTGQLRLLVSSRDGRPNVKSASFEAISQDGSRVAANTKPRALGSTTVLRGEIAPEALQRAGSLAVAIDLANGRRVEAACSPAARDRVALGAAAGRRDGG